MYKVATNPFQKNLFFGTLPNLIITPHISSDSEGNYIANSVKNIAGLKILNSGYRK